MPDVPSTIPGLGGGIGWEPGVSQGTNNSWPTWGGVGLEPNTTVKFDIDGTVHHANVDENGTWEFSPPNALANGDHKVEMWSENITTGERSPVTDWDVNVDADSAARQNDYRRHKDWKEGGADRFREANRGTPTPTGGGGGGGGQPPEGEGEEGEGQGQEGEGQEGEGGTQPGGGSPGGGSRGGAGLEKGNQPEGQVLG